MTTEKDTVTSASGPQLLDGIRLNKPIASGRISRLYAASDRCGADAVVKVLSPSQSSNDRVLVRFYASARAAMLLDHPRVVDIREVRPAGGLHYQLMELLPGGDLAGRLARTPRLPVPAALRIVTQLAEALDVVHAAGFVHRDVTPESVLLSNDFEPVLGRFGLVYNFGGKQDLTDLWGGPGTFAYACPQQLRDPADVQPVDDIYSLGVLLFHCMTGELPFAGYSLQSIIDQKQAGLSGLSDSYPEIDPRACALIEQCLAPKREDRPATGWHVARQTSEILGRKISDYWIGPPRLAPMARDSDFRWHVLVEDEKGGRNLRTATQQQISCRVIRGVFSPWTLAAEGPGEPFLPLAQHSVFAPLFNMN